MTTPSGLDTAARGQIASATQRLTLRRLQVLVVLALLAVLAAAVTYGHIQRQRAAVDQGAAELLELEARALEGQVSRVADATANALNAIATWPSLHARPMSPQQLGGELQAQLPGLPFVRSLSVLDDHGHVLASSAARNVGLTVLPARFEGRPAAPSVPQLGQHLPGRDLADLVDAGAPRAAGLAGSLPMLLRLERREGPLWLVALIGLDYLTNVHAMMVDHQSASAAVLDLQGLLLSHTGEPSVGTDLSGLPPFATFLPQHEHGSYQGPGSAGVPVLAAFRTARRWPLVVLAERPQASIDAGLREPVATALAGLAVVIGLLAGLGWTAQRSLRREARVLAEREVMHDQVSRTEERWKRALDAAGQFVWELDLRASIFTASAGLNRLLGYGSSESKWNVEQWQSRLHRDDLPAATERFRQHLQGESPAYEVEQRMLTADGRWVWVLVRGMVTRWENGGLRALTVSGTLADIGPRKASEQALRASEARQQAILSSALDGIVTMDGNGNVLDFNPAAEGIFGIHRADVIGRSLHDVIVPHHLRQRHREGFARYRRTGIGTVLNRRIELEGLRANGEVFPIELAIVPVKTDAGEVFTATVRDISVQRRVQRDLRASEAQFRSVFEQAAVGMVQSDRAGRTLHANAAICRMLGLRAQDMARTAMDQLLHADDGDADPRSYYQVLLGGADNVSVECRYRHHAGHWIWVRVTASLMHTEGEHHPVMLSIIEDISARKDAEQQLAQARRREIDAGARTQRTLLGTQPDQRMQGLWLGTLSAASQVIDGDFVEVLPLSEGVVDVVVGDVMGKGVNAALFGAATKMRFSRCMAELLARRTDGHDLPRPARVIAALHEAMTPSLQALESFVTISYMRLDTVRRTVTWVGCGSEEPLLVSDGGVRTLANQHPPLGVLSHLDFEDDTLPMEPGDAVFVASDGAADALLPDGDRLGRERVNAMIVDLLGASRAPATVLHALRKSLGALHADIVDDLTLALVVASGDTLAASRRELAQGLNDIVHVRGLVENRAQRCGFGDTDTGLFVTACVEAYTNVLRHTPGRVADAPVEMIVRLETQALTVEFVTVGDPFDAPEPPAETSFEDYPEGGFGLTIMAQATDRVEYLHRSGINTVRLTRLRPPLQA